MTSVSGISVPDDAVWTTTVIVHTPAMDTCEPFPIQRSPWCFRSSVLGPTPAIPTGSNRSETSVASSGAPESKSVTSTLNPFGPAVPGVITSETFMVVAKSLPVSVTRAGAAGGAIAGGRGARPVSMPVSEKTPMAPTSSIAMTLRRSPVRVSIRGIERYRLNAPSPISTRTSATLTSSVVPYEPRNRSNSFDTPPTSCVARSTPVTSTTASA